MRGARWGWERKNGDGGEPFGERLSKPVIDAIQQWRRGHGAGSRGAFGEALKFCSAVASRPNWTTKGTSAMRYISQRVRPVRLAFVVRPSEDSEFRKAICANTVLWGGAFNPIVPNARYAPASSSETSGRKYLKGVLQSFDPDFVVYQGSMPVGLDAYEKLLVPLSKVVEARGRVRHGLSVREVYDHYYNTHFQYARRGPAEQLVIPRLPRKWNRLGDVVFGRYPNRAWSDAFARLGAEPADVEPQSLAELALAWTSRTPLGFTLRGTGLRTRISPWLFVLDPSDTKELLDFWNLRALGCPVVPVPGPVDGKYLASVRTVLAQMRGRGDFDPFRNWWVAVTGSQRSHVTADMLGLPEKRVLFRPLPPIWDPVALDDQLLSPLDSLSGRATQISDEGEYSVALESPAVLRTEDAGSRCWSVELSFSDYSSWTLPGVFPAGIDHDAAQRLVGFGTSRDSVRIGPTGPRVIVDGLRTTLFGSLPSSQNVVEEWLRGKGCEPRLSSAGRAALEFTRLVGGPRSARHLAGRDVRKLFARASNSTLASIKQGELLGALANARDSNRVAAKNLLTRLRQNGGVRIGVTVVCSECEEKGFHALDKLSERLECPRCLREFAVPLDVHRLELSYRPRGALALRGGAQGAFAVVTTVAALMHSAEPPGGFTWAPSMEVSLPGDRQVEVDFIAFWKGFRGGPWPRLLLGECKTQGTFEDKDLQNMDALARFFPGACLVFATLKASLDADECWALRRLAKRRPDCSVLILTERELLHWSGVPSCWHKSGGRHETAYRRLAGTPYSLEDLAKATRYLYLPPRD